MKETTNSEIDHLLARQKAFFSSLKTKSYHFRIEQLKKLKKAILLHEDFIYDALKTDLGKSKQEAYYTEVGLVLDELDFHIKNLKDWMSAKKAPTPLKLWPSSSKIYHEPLGISLIMAPWNYPFQLLINPLIGCISAGCCAIVKPSPYTPHVAKVIEKMLLDNFESDYISCVLGGRDMNEILLAKKFDLIFFTGSPAMGKVVMKAAAENLTAIILELGGKSPCIVDEHANIEKAAKRIAWGKTINAGQTCIAPDYLFVHHSIKDELIAKIKACFTDMYGINIKESEFYPRIVNEKAFDRLHKMMQQGKIVVGGKTDRANKYIEPTLIDHVTSDFLIMQEEIFGPLLPIISFEEISEAIDYINKNEKPLSFYYFGKSKQAKEILQQISFGGGCINDTLIHFANHHLPFGGVGNSGKGVYHGYNSFQAFSNSQGVMKSLNLLDLPLRYPPFKWFKLVKKVI
ncbi:MAG: aldehyde dehydrogenase [Bacteroidetes bacterium]|nr:aldehyde dehydrogenase [Bacteroidota bacterium]